MAVWPVTQITFISPQEPATALWYCDLCLHFSFNYAHLSCSNSEGSTSILILNTELQKQACEIKASAVSLLLKDALYMQQLAGK